MKRSHTAIDIFGGCGGLSKGFEKAGFKVVAASELWSDAVKTYKKNHPTVKVIEGDVSREENKQELYDYLDGMDVDVVMGGVPCQGYSLAGNRDPEDPRGRLYLDFLQIIDKIRPKLFLMENVKGLTSMKHVKENISKSELQGFRKNCWRIKRLKDLKRFKAQRMLTPSEEAEFQGLNRERPRLMAQINGKLMPLLTKMGHKMNEMGYKIKYEILNAADFGVAQTRERLFLIGTRLKNFSITFPREIYTEEPNKSFSRQYQKKRWVPVKAVLNKYEKMDEDVDLSHIFTNHSQAFIAKIKNTPPGGNVFPNYSGAFWRLDPNRPARTVKENHGSVFIHYSLDRTCTPRELAALQSFDDTFQFTGTKSSILKQIGNAVPPLLAQKIAENMITFFL